MSRVPKVVFHKWWPALEPRVPNRTVPQPRRCFARFQESVASIFGEAAERAKASGATSIPGYAVSIAW